MIIHTRTCAPWFPFIALGWRPSLSHGVEGPAHARAGSVPSRSHHFTLHPSFSLSMHAVFSLTSRSGIRGTLLLKRSVQMPSPSQSLRIYDQSRKGPHLESFPESQVSSKFSLACFCSIWSLLPWHVSTFWFSMCVCLLNRELYSLCCIPRHWLCAYHIAGTQYLTKEWLKENSALIFFLLNCIFWWDKNWGPKFYFPSEITQTIRHRSGWIRAWAPSAVDMLWMRPPPANQ